MERDANHDQIRSVPKFIGSSGGKRMRNQQKSSSSPFGQRPPWAVSSWAGSQLFGFIYLSTTFSVDHRQTKFLWAHKEADLAPHLVIGLMLQVGDAVTFPQALGLYSRDLFLSQQTGSHSRREHTFNRRWSDNRQIRSNIKDNDNDDEDAVWFPLNVSFSS